MATPALTPHAPRPLSLVPDISVIVATRNRVLRLQGAFAGLATQETQGQFTYEVVVVDNGSTDATREMVEEQARGFPAPLRYLYEPRVGKPWAVNTGFQAAQGGIFVITDDDVRVTPTWLAALWSCFTETQADAVGGRILPRWVGPRPAWLADEAVARPFVFGALGCVDHGGRRLVSTRQRRYYWVGGNLAVRREVVDELGGFHVRMIRAQDSAYLERCLRSGKKVVYEPEALAYHVIGADRLTPAYFRMWWGRRGYYRAYRSPWKAHHLVTVVPLGQYADLCRLNALWVAKGVTRRPWGERLLCEVRLRAWWAEWRGRLRLLPTVWRVIATQGLGALRGAPRYIDFERFGWVARWGTNA